MDGGALHAAEDEEEDKKVVMLDHRSMNMGAGSDHVPSSGATTTTPPFIPLQSLTSLGGHNLQPSATHNMQMAGVAVQGLLGDGNRNLVLQQPLSQRQQAMPQQQEVRQQHQPPAIHQQGDAMQSSNAVKRPGGSSQAISFGTLMPMLLPTLQQDQGEKLLNLYQRLRRSEISKEDFLRATRLLVGDQVLVNTVKKMQLQQQQQQLQGQIARQPQDVQQPSFSQHVLQQQQQQQQQQQSKQSLEILPTQQQQVQGQNSHDSERVKSTMLDLEHIQQAKQLDTPLQHQTNLQSRVSQISSVQMPPPKYRPEQWHEQQSQSTSGSLNLQQVKTEGDKSTVGDLASGQSTGATADTAMTYSMSQTGSSLTNTKTISVPVPLNIPDSASQPTGSGGNQARTPPKKSTSDQRKSSETSPVMQGRSKKQKVGGDVLEQSIDQLNDVTAVSGVNLREEEEQLLAGPKEESRSTQAMRRFAQEEEGRLFLEKGPLRTKLAAIAAKHGISIISEEVDQCLSMSTEERLRSMLYKLIKISCQRGDQEKGRHKIVVTSDIQRQIALIRKKAKEEQDKKQALESERLKKLNEEKERASQNEAAAKEDGRTKDKKAQKAEESKQRANAANMAARTAAGVDDMLMKWQMMAEQGRQKREGELGASASNDSNMGPNSGLTAGNREVDKKPGFGDARTATKVAGEGSITGASAAFKKAGPTFNKGLGQRAMQIAKAPPRTITVKDVIAYLETEPQMAKSTLLYRLYDKSALTSQVG